jgi:hypothetical protein
MASISDIAPLTWKGEIIVSTFQPYSDQDVKPLSERLALACSSMVHPVATFLKFNFFPSRTIYVPIVNQNIKLVPTPRLVLSLYKIGITIQIKECPNMFVLCTTSVDTGMLPCWIGQT